MSDQIVEGCARNQGRSRSNTTNDFARLRRVNPCLHFCWIESFVESLLPRVRASPSVRTAKSRFCTFTSQRARASWEGRSGRRKSIEHTKHHLHLLSLLTIVNKKLYRSSNQQQNIPENMSAPAPNGANTAAAPAANDARDPSGFLSEIIGAPVTVKLNSGVVYKGMYMLSRLILKNSFVSLGPKIHVQVADT